MDIKLLWKDVLEQNREELKKYFCSDAEIHWPCTNERFSADEFIRVNCDYPGEWSGEVERVENTDVGCITVTRVFARDSSAALYVVSFFTCRDEKIAFVEEYWSNEDENRETDPKVSGKEKDKRRTGKDFIAQAYCSCILHVNTT